MYLSPILFFLTDYPSDSKAGAVDYICVISGLYYLGCYSEAVLNRPLTPLFLLEWICSLMSFIFQCYRLLMHIMLSEVAD